MTVRGAWLLNDPTTGQTPADTRLAPVGTWTPSADGGVLTALTAPTVAAGADNVGTLTPGSGMSATLAPVPVVIQGAAAGQGAYPVCVTQAETITLSDGDPSNPRIDLVCVQVYDQLYDASGQTAYAVVVVEGTPAASPVAPDVPDNALALYSIPVPAGASASSPPDWEQASWLPQYLTAAAGGIMVATSAAALPDGVYDGQYADAAGQLYRWSVSSSAWEPYPAEAPYCGLRGSSISVPSDTNYHSLTFSSVLSSNHAGMWSSAAATRLVIPQNGTYALSGVANWPGALGANQARAIVYKNGASSEVQFNILQASEGNSAQVLSDSLVCSAGDYLEVWANQGSGSAVSLSWVHFTARLVSTATGPAS